MRSTRGCGGRSRWCRASWLDDSLIDAAFEAGCDDAAIGRVDGIQYIDFDRESASLEQAIVSAVADLERIDGVHQDDA